MKISAANMIQQKYCNKTYIMILLHNVFGDIATYT